jgi:hypothetical protein
MHSGWTFLTNHGHVLLAVASTPDARVQDVAATVGITPRATLHILQDLEDAGYIHRTRVGRRNHYTLHRDRPFRHPTTAHHNVDELLTIFSDLALAPGGTRTPRPKDTTTPSREEPSGRGTSPSAGRGAATSST